MTLFMTQVALYHTLYDKRWSYMTLVDFPTEAGMSGMMLALRVKASPTPNSGYHTADSHLQ